VMPSPMTTTVITIAAPPIIVPTAAPCLTSDSCASHSSDHRTNSGAATAACYPTNDGSGSCSSQCGSSLRCGWLYRYQNNNHEHEGRGYSANHLSAPLFGFCLGRVVKDLSPPLQWGSPNVIADARTSLACSGEIRFSLR
jgi:hypothetical protein